MFSAHVCSIHWWALDWTEWQEDRGAVWLEWPLYCQLHQLGVWETRCYYCSRRLCSHQRRGKEQHLGMVQMLHSWKSSAKCQQEFFLFSFFNLTQYMHSFLNTFMFPLFLFWFSWFELGPSIVESLPLLFLLLRTMVLQWDVQKKGPIFGCLDICWI